MKHAEDLMSRFLIPSQGCWMSFGKKTAKGRLDKYYRLAKEQGYRARSAFKLVQLNKKFEFLNQAKVVIDLCAAPGGWLQVAAKSMPASHLIIGVDLVPIRPIHNVISMVNDITTEKCRVDLKRELKDWKADVVMNDGAPNVGKAWLQDAFTQSELVLSALKLATEFLIEGGWFITKVFRSKDYNSLLWVFSQLFKKVEATKPSSSRDVSAEIFVVCKGYLAPRHIDPKFLDPKFVFSDVESLLASSKNSSKTNLLHPEKKKRHRDGYEDGVNVLYKKLDATNFIQAPNFVDLLAESNSITFDEKLSETKVILGCPETLDEIKACCQDLKVLGRREFKLLLKWRQAMRIKLGYDSNAITLTVEGSENIQNEDEDIEKLDKSIKNSIKRDKRRALERKAKQRLRLQLQMENANDIANDICEDGLFSLKKVKNSMIAASETIEYNEYNESVLDSDNDSKMSENSSLDSLSEAEDDDDIDGKGVLIWEQSIEEEYKRFKTERAKKNYEKPEFSEHENDEIEEKSENEMTESESGGENENSLLVPIQKPDEIIATNSARASLWYSNPLFQSMKKISEEITKHQQDKKTKSKNRQYQKAPADAIIEEFAESEGSTEAAKNNKQTCPDPSIVFVKAEDPYEDAFDSEEAKKVLLTGEGMSAALRLAQGNRKKVKEELIDETFNRRSFAEKSSDLPLWFVEDEVKHNKPNKPLTKEAADAIRMRLKAINERPIKKVLEAKGRNKIRVIKKLESLKKKAEAIAGSEEVGEKAKMIQISKMLRKSTTRKEQPKLVVARGLAKGLKGRPKGVKGRYKMVDRRMLKELRAKKRIEQRKKK